MANVAAGFFTDEEDRNLALRIAENEGRLHDARRRRDLLLVWDDIYRSFYANDTVRKDRSRLQIHERYKSMKKSTVGKAKLEEAREQVAAAEALLELRSEAREVVAAAEALLELRNGI